MGMPGCHGPLAELVTYLAEAPKSTRAYEGYNRAERLVKRDPTLFIPISMRDMPVRVMEAMGEEVYKYHPEYRYAMSRLHGLGSQNFFVIRRHPVTNEYLPSSVQGKVILRKEGDLSDKLWDEDALRRWEELENEGQAWIGRRVGNVT